LESREHTHEIESVAAGEDLDDIDLEGFGADGAVVGLCGHGDCAAQEDFFAGTEFGHTGVV
jgi:hypothetical protein